MVDLENIKSVYLIGIGGIGMSALARYFLNRSLRVGGYDRTATKLTDELAGEGCAIHFAEDISLIDEIFKEPRHTLVIYTPAVPAEHKELEFFRQSGFQIAKRSEVLGSIAHNTRTAAIAGTHGKTTVSSMLAHILFQSGTRCNAFVGGIMKNYGSNVILSPQSEITVVEADEFDQSFLQLTPSVAIITSCDPDHLDIYKDYSSLTAAFNRFAGQITEGGSLLLNERITGKIKPGSRLKTYTYSLQGKTDFHAEKITVEGKKQFFDLVYPGNRLNSIELNMPGTVNIENAVAAIAGAWMLGTDPEEAGRALASYMGVRRRFDIRLETPAVNYIDDYAHHPEEIRAFIRTVREMLPGKMITGIFQPHLYSRTRDLADGFAESLGDLDELILLDIYPAREKPLPGVTSSIIFDRVMMTSKQRCSMDNLITVLSKHHYEVVVTMGAGDIERTVEPLEKLLSEKVHRS
jgi:UDP-N-acetylmuramate--alanine ligase